MTMNQRLEKKSIGETPPGGIVEKLLEADLLLAAEAFGASLDDKKRAGIDTLTCPEEQFLQKTLKIAEICGDRLLAERAQQRMTYPGLQYNLSPATLSALEIYAERFYSFWEGGKLTHVRSEMADFPQWYNRARKTAEEVFPAHDLENILVMCCAKERTQKGPLLWKLLSCIIDSEIVRIGYVYLAREVTHETFFNLLQRMKDLLLIREQHDSSLQLGEHPEELIPYVWANIVKNMLNQNLISALDNINALAYLHYAAQETESTTGSEAYAKLKRELLLFREGKQHTWPNEMRKLFLNPTMVEGLTRYRFMHGLAAVNTGLAYRCVKEAVGRLQLSPGEEDAVVLNGLIMAGNGYLRSSGFQDGAIKEQFQRNILYFKRLQDGLSDRGVAGFCTWQEEMRTTCEGLEEKLLASRKQLASLLQEKKKKIISTEALMKSMGGMDRKPKKSILRRLRSDMGAHKSEALAADIEKDKRDFKVLLETYRIYEDMVNYIRKTEGFFS